VAMSDTSGGQRQGRQKVHGWTAAGEGAAVLGRAEGQATNRDGCKGCLPKPCDASPPPIQAHVIITWRVPGVTDDEYYSRRPS
jgi:hypothetical protein